MKFNVMGFCNYITKTIGEELGYKDEKLEVINYGVFSIIQTMMSILLVIIVGSLFNVLIEGLIVSFAISILRKYTGGAHASTPEKCLILGTIFSVIIAISAKSIILNYDVVKIIITIIFLISYIGVFKLAPVGSENKPISSEKRKKRLKQNSIIILTCYLIIVMGGINMYNESLNDSILIYLMCLCLGTIWQVFSLTSIGHLVSNKLELLL